ncbi:MAG TPA: DEAD/DEAH box helicase, partial [Acidimicrobiales bacterium]|nr:DEAD/DEAH box helicase [Acidimicrobiales bacterium]
AGRRGLDALVESISVLQGGALVASTLESDILPARVAGYRAADLDELCTSGHVVWTGAGALGGTDGRVRLCFRDQVHLLGGETVEEAPPGSVHDALRSHLAAHGACFWAELRAAAPEATDGELLAALWDLVWAGEVTNDSIAPLRAYVTATRGTRSGRGPVSRTRGARPRPGRLTQIGPPAGAGRWSLIAPLLSPAPTPTEAAHARALQLLERHGILTREAALAEGVPGGFAGVYGVLKVLEERGQARRGYFVSGLGAAQFALPGAVDRLRDAREAPAEDGGPLVLAATDPAQPYGAALSWPDSPGRPARSAGALVVSVSGTALVWFDPRARHLVTFPAAATDKRWAEALAMLVKDGRLRTAEVRKVDGNPLASGDVDDALRAAGFAEGYRGRVLRG